MDKLCEVENYLLRGEYPLNFTKAEKSNLRRRCRNNFRIELGVLQYRANSKSTEEEEWKVAVRSNEEKQRILESCHAGMEG